MGAEAPRKGEGGISQPYQTGKGSVCKRTRSWEGVASLRPQNSTAELPPPCIQNPGFRSGPKLFSLAVL